MTVAWGIVGKAFAVWLGILVLAVANGAFREAVLIPALGKRPAFVLSGVLLSAFILAAACLALPWFGRAPAVSYVAVGLGWLCLTLAFEILFGRFVRGQAWSQILETYTFKDGNIWPVVLLVTAAAPYLAARFRGWA